MVLYIQLFQVTMFQISRIEQWRMLCRFSVFVCLSFVLVNLEGKLCGRSVSWINVLRYVNTSD
jgi:hypothetical protein